MLKHSQRIAKSSLTTTYKRKFLFCDGSTNAATLKEVVKSVVQEEDRSRNVMVFGLPERKDEKLEERVQEVFQEIGLKPTLQASRVGKINQGKSKRPVKVSL